MKARKEEFHRARPPDTERLCVYKAAKHVPYAMLNRCETRGAHRSEQEQRKYYRPITRISSAVSKRVIFFFLRPGEFQSESLFSVLAWVPQGIDCGRVQVTHSVENSNSFNSGHALLAAPAKTKHTYPTLTCGVCGVSHSAVPSGMMAFYFRV